MQPAQVPATEQRGASRPLLYDCPRTTVRDLARAGVSGKLHTLMLDGKNRLIGVNLASPGSLSASVVRARGVKAAGPDAQS